MIIFKPALFNEKVFVVDYFITTLYESDKENKFVKIIKMKI